MTSIMGLPRTPVHGQSQLVTDRRVVAAAAIMQHVQRNALYSPCAVPLLSLFNCSISSRNASYSPTFRARKYRVNSAFAAMPAGVSK